MSKKSSQQSSGPDFLTNFVMFWVFIGITFGIRACRSEQLFKDPVEQYKIYQKESDEFYRQHPELK